MDTPEVDMAALQIQREALLAQYDELSTMFVEGVLDGPGVRKASADLKSKMAHVDAKLADAVRTSPTAALLATAKELRKRWAEMTPSLRSQVIEEVAVVTILLCPPGMRRFDDAYIDIEWRRG